MMVFSDERQALHAPLRELHNGEWMPYAEVPARLARIQAEFGDRTPVTDHGLAPIYAVHDVDYVAFLECAYERWQASGRTGDALGYTFPITRRRKLDLTRIDAALGAYSMDVATPITVDTWQSAYWSAESALSGISAIANGAERAVALCRPPGHHAGPNYMGGYCYLNNAAIAAQQAAELGLGPVAILDVDYHHGNGTQDIFYSDPDVLFVSIHADPLTDFPFYWGHADETGEGAGSGSTLNIPMPRGTVWSAYACAMEVAINRIRSWGAKILIVSYGADTYEGDPISNFQLKTRDYLAMGTTIGQLDLPVLTVVEGGYDIASLGKNVAAFCAGLDYSRRINQD